MLYRGILATCAVGAMAVASAPALADTLEEAVLAAYEENPNIEQTRAFTRIADEGVTQAKALYGPQVNLLAEHNFAYNRNVVPGTTFSNDGFSTRAEITLDQPIFTFGRLASNLDVATATRQSRVEDLRFESQTLIFNVVSAYMDLRRDIELYLVAADIYDLLDQQRGVTQSRFDLRDATAPDVDQTLNRAELAAGRLLEARANMEASAAAYRALVGEYPDTLAPPPPLPPLSTIDETYLVAEQNNPEILSALYVREGTKAQLAAARANMAPRVDARATIGRVPLSQFENEAYSEQVVAGVRLTMPMYSGGTLASRVREALERNVAAQYFVEQVRRDVRASLATNYNLYRSSERYLPRYLAAVTAAQRAVEGVQQQETSGIRTLRDVLDVTNDLFNARSAAVRAMRDQYVAHAGVLRDAGLLSVDLFAQNAQYDPDSYSPGQAALAGLPLLPLLDPLDSLAVRKTGRQADVAREDDTVFETGQTLNDPLD